MRGNHASVPARLAFARLVPSKKLKQVHMPTLNKLAWASTIVLFSQKSFIASVKPLESSAKL
eukprot:scaffold25929_cov57-Phaeocystis_antarctica.AAC.1